MSKGFFICPEKYRIVGKTAAFVYVYGFFSFGDLSVCKAQPFLKYIFFNTYSVFVFE